MFSGLDTSAISMTYVLQSLAKWETVTLEETSSDGAESSIQVPTQPGLCLQESLLRFTSNLSRLSPSPYLRENLTREVLHFVLDKYTPLLDTALASKSLVQRMNIQFLFDVKYLSNVLVTNQSQDTLVKHKIVDFEKAIDVFDLEIILPHLNANMDRCVGKTQCLLGIKCTHAHSSGHVTMTSSSSVVVPVAKDVPWFPVLLLSNASQSAGILPLSQTVKATKPAAVSESVSSLSASAKSTFFAVTDWFG